MLVKRKIKYAWVHKSDQNATHALLINCLSEKRRGKIRLSRLWQQQGKRVEAYNLLAPVYNWFTEGFDTPDLQEAKALLEELG
jgi:predicted ATPase